MKPVAAVFDLFGTLLDIASLRAAAAGIADDPDAFVATWRDKQIAYSFASAIMGTHEDFDAVTGHALRYTAAKFGIALVTSNGWDGPMPAWTIDDLHALSGIIADDRP